MQSTVYHRAVNILGFYRLFPSSESLASRNNPLKSYKDKSVAREATSERKR